MKLIHSFWKDIKNPIIEMNKTTDEQEQLPNKIRKFISKTRLSNPNMKRIVLLKGREMEEYCLIVVLKGRVLFHQHVPFVKVLRNAYTILQIKNQY